MSYAEPASQRELTDGRAKRASRRPHHDEACGPWTQQDDDHDRDYVLSAVRRLLDTDPVAATVVAACVSVVQSSTESRQAFVKRIVRAWLDEMGRVAR